MASVLEDRRNATNDEASSAELLALITDTTGTMGKRVVKLPKDLSKSILDINPIVLFEKSNPTTALTGANIHYNELSFPGGVSSLSAFTKLEIGYIYSVQVRIANIFPKAMIATVAVSTESTTNGFHVNMRGAGGTGFNIHFTDDSTLDTGESAPAIIQSLGQAASDYLFIYGYY